MVENEQGLNKLFADVRDKLNAEGRGDDPRFRMAHSYFEGQRAEAVWEGTHHISIAQMRTTAELARQAQLYIMHALLGWQLVDYSRCALFIIAREMVVCAMLSVQLSLYKSLQGTLSNISRSFSFH